MRTLGALVAGLFTGLVAGVLLGFAPPLLGLAGAVAGVLIERRTR